MSIDIWGDAYSLPKRSDRHREIKEHTRTWADDVSKTGATTSTLKAMRGLVGSGVEDVENDESIYRINKEKGK